jgi:hypothetical protein
VNINCIVIVPFNRWKVDYSPSTVHLGGELLGQTQVAYPKYQTLTEPVPFNHPLDLHFSSSGVEVRPAMPPSVTMLGLAVIAISRRYISCVNHFLHLQGWGALRIALQTYRVDIHGRRILCGYGFAHLPTSPGLHRLEVNTHSCIL